ncbi:3-oxoacyl-[acyl-carrier protein] reductase [Brevinematales bacterium NS]|jgi:3-oxoacyl-[acyl-carrier protein] reductase|nr:3-oxoacyl-ACP reductase FabG [Brevinematales bacterium]QJR22276.1 3-oxoacyl-[acyl-carrier protein] reductase [Brevinematales bacterium NS]
MGKIALVTGGSRGIGRAIVRELTENGYFVCFTYRRGKEEAYRIVQEIGEDKVKAFECNIQNFDEVKEKVEEEVIKPFGACDVLVNNAGITKDNLFPLMEIEDFREVIEVNLIGMANVTNVCIKSMMGKREGVVVNIASVSGILGSFGQTNYAAAKAGIIAFTKALAREVGKYNIRVVGVAPGFVETEMFAKIPFDKKKQMIGNVSLGRAGKPEEIASIVSFLVSSKASYITGTTIIVDGGLV